MAGVHGPGGLADQILGDVVRALQFAFVLQFHLAGDGREARVHVADAHHGGVTPHQAAAFGVGEKGKADPIEMYLNDVFTVTVNMAGLPGISVPAGLDGQGLPLGLQLIGRPFDEETLFSLGQVIEDAAGHYKPEKWWA